MTEKKAMVRSQSLLCYKKESSIEKTSNLIIFGHQTEPKALGLKILVAKLRRNTPQNPKDIKRVFWSKDTINLS